jgi:hypothetical protein
MGGAGGVSFFFPLSSLPFPFPFPAYLHATIIRLCNERGCPFYKLFLNSAWSLSNHAAFSFYLYSNLLFHSTNILFF